MTPKALLDRPALLPYLAQHMESFYDMSSQREIGDTPQPIRISEMLAYAELTSLYGAESRDRFLKFIRALDAAYLKKVRESLKK